MIYTRMNGFDYKEWYDKNKEEISRRRRERYKNDKKYRSKILRKNREYRERNSNKKRNRRKDDTNTKEPVVMDVTLAGVTYRKKMVYVGDLANAVNRSVATIHKWERSGLLPVTPFRTESYDDHGSFRLYTEDMVDAVKKVVDKRGDRVYYTDTSFRMEVESKWRNLGVIKDER